MTPAEVTAAIEECRCTECGVTRWYGPCACTFWDNGVAAYYQRAYRKRRALAEGGKR